jgi:hypothetical protein
MLNIKYCTKLSASLLLLSSIVFAAQAQAQSIDVPFNGTITNTCTFGVVTDGQLAQAGSLAAIEGSTGVDTLGTGNAAQVSVDCPNGANLTVAAPVAVSVPPTFNPSVIQSIVQRGSNTASTDFTSANVNGPFDSNVWDKSTAPLVLPAGNSDLNVAMIAGENAVGTIPSGFYSYTVTLTVAPN